LKILLIYVITENVNLPVMPLGMACVAASVQNAGHTVKSVSMSPEVIAPMIGAAMSDFAPDIIGISVRNIDDQKMRNPVFLLDPVKSAVSCCRRLSTAPIVLGGAGYSIFPESVLRFTGADMGIQGEGESAFPALIYRISRHEPIQDIAGLWLSGQTPLSAKRVPERLDAHPMAPVDLLKSLSTGLEKQDFWLPYQTRRGCPMKCSYCSTPQIEGELLRQKPIDRVIRELEGYAAAGFRRIFFVDNTFNIPASYARTLCEAIIQAGLKISWRCILYPWKADPDLIRKMAAAGCAEVSLGFESGNLGILDRMNKKFTPLEVRQFSDLLETNGIRRTGFLLLGGPGENLNTVMESLAFAESLKLDALKLTAGIRIYPNTPLARCAIEEGIIRPEDDLLDPRFYLAKGLEERLFQIVEKWAVERPYCLF